jgi:adenylate cyclase
LLKPKLLVGRHRSCDIPLSYSTVSSRHCELELLDGFWFVRDLGSSNGTSVNGRRCTTEWLVPNDTLAVSGHRYTVFYTPPADRPPPQRVTDPTERKAPAATPGARGLAKPERPTDQQVWEPGASGISLGKLVPCGGGPPIPLMRPKLIVGRNRGCDIVLRYAAVSGRHCELEWSNGRWSVRDLGSRNGTGVDDVRCEAQTLMPGNILWIGGLRFVIVYRPEGQASRPDHRGPRFTQSLLEKAGLAEGPWEPSVDGL